MALVVGEVVGQIEPRSNEEPSPGKSPTEEAPRPPASELSREVLATLERRTRRLEAD